MQAPAAPSGPPASEPGERACPSCGAANGPLAAFCWQCYGQFRGGTGQPAVYAGPGGLAQRPGLPIGELRRPGYGPAAAPEPLLQPRTGRSLAGMVGTLVFVVAIAAGVFVFMNRGAAPELPGSMGGLSRINDPAMDQAIDVFRSMAEDEGVSADMGIYGAAGIPSAALIWVTGVAAPEDGEGFAEFAEGFNTGLGTGSLDQSRRTTEVVDGVTFECAPVVGEPPGSVCLWQEGDVFWMVFELSGSDLGTTQGLAVAAHATASA